MAEFSQILKRLRTENGMTQKELADKLGIAKSAISMYECGTRRPNFEIAEALTDYFHVDLSYLIGSTDKIDRLSCDETDPGGAEKKYLNVTDEELRLVRAWRHADAQTRRIVAYALKFREDGEKDDQ